jgi:hypothetical protein
MLEKIKDLVNTKLEDLNMEVCDAYTEEVEQKIILNIEVDSNEVIDLNKVTAASRIINDILDKEKTILENIDELDIYSKKKGE